MSVLLKEEKVTDGRKLTFSNVPETLAELQGLDITKNAREALSFSRGGIAQKV